MMRSLGLMLLAAGLAGGCLAEDSAEDGSTGAEASGDGGCPVGNPGCPCSALGGCISPLVCTNGVCAPASGATSSDAGSDATSDATSDSTSTATTESSSEATSVATDAATSSAETSGSAGSSGGSSGTGGAGSHRIFVTSGVFDGAQIGGLDGADALCETAAGAGNWVAVLRTDTTDYPDRISISGPVERLDGTVVAMDSAAFFSSTLLASINLDENQSTVTNGTRVWVGSATAHCGSWSSTGGDGRTVRVGEADLLLDGSADQTCATGRRLFCISQ